AVAHHHAPCHCSVLTGGVSLHVGGVDVHHLALLRTQVAEQLTRDVKGAEAGVVGTHVERVTGHPDVVHAAVLGLVPGHRLRRVHVRDVDHLHPTVGTAGRCILCTLDTRRREDF